MQTYCLGCGKHTANIGSKRKITMRNKVKCASFMSDKRRFLNQKPNKKLVGTILMLNFSYTNHYKTC